jgi:hypothetical protein
MGRAAPTPDLDSTVERVQTVGGAVTIRVHLTA